MSEELSNKVKESKIHFETFKDEIINDYKIVYLSRQLSIMGRKEVLTGKAKFGIFGDGKELAQIAMAKEFAKGDFRSGYYRDQTFMMAIEKLDAKIFFAGLYADTNVNNEPFSAGRQMGGHFSTKLIDENQNWLELSKLKNSSSDTSPTASQMPRLLGLALASKLFRQNSDLHQFESLSNKGSEIAWGTIGDASTSEGLFYETINAACVLEVPMLISVWDDGYGISVSKKYQTTKESISEILKGFEIQDDTNGLKIFTTVAWDYPSLCYTYHKAAKYCRENHRPVLVHVEQCTQPQGHSTSGSHERYKSKERLQWEKDNDCVTKFKQWILDYNKDNRTIITLDELEQIENEINIQLKEDRKIAWSNYINPIKNEKEEILEIVKKINEKSINNTFIEKEIAKYTSQLDYSRQANYEFIHSILLIIKAEEINAKKELIILLEKYNNENYKRYNSKLFLDENNIIENTLTYDQNAEMVDGRIILNKNMDYILSTNPLVLTFGEDTGKIGGVNQSTEGLQEKYGELRVSDTGIREATIIGQGIGLSMRGLRPIAEIQYLDYLLYGLQEMSDDLATVSYRTFGQQKAPLIVSTRGHRLEGIWHSGSPMGTLLNSLKGIYICVPRNMTVAAGFYNYLIQSNNPSLVIEPLNGYRKKEKLPSNIGNYTVKPGIVEILKEGKDITLVSYGSTLNICMEIMEKFELFDIDIEVIDVQSLYPFDINNDIAKSISKTNKVIFVDEDYQGGASAFMMQQVIEKQNIWQLLDSAPKTISAFDNRPAYGSDGDYFSKPNKDNIFMKIYEIMNEYNPMKYPKIY